MVVALPTKDRRSQYNIPLIIDPGLGKRQLVRLGLTFFSPEDCSPTVTVYTLAARPLSKELGLRNGISFDDGL